MQYREMLKRCLNNPGWLGTNEQKDSDSKLKYSSWMRDQETESSRSESKTHTKGKVKK